MKPISMIMPESKSWVGNLTKRFGFTMAKREPPHNYPIEATMKDLEALGFKESIPTDGSMDRVMSRRHATCPDCHNYVAWVQGRELICCDNVILPTYELVRFAVRPGSVRKVSK
jgi:hypothetical protein